MRSIAIRALLTVAAVYCYFLLFAQFAFVELVRAAGLGTSVEKTLLGCMALAGIVSGFLAARFGPESSMIRGALVAAAVGSSLAVFSTGPMMFCASAVFTGAALGVGTVSLAALLPRWCGLPIVGIGTGLGYAICNIPAVFQSAPAHQAWVSTVVAVVGVVAVPCGRNRQREVPQQRFSFVSALFFFMALVWMDSAAFFIIQHAGDLRSATWGEAFLWRNATLHLLAAMVSGLLLSRSPKIAPLTGWLFLTVAACLVNSESSRGLAGWLYPPGVSLYSVALVAWPGWFSGARDSRSAAWRAAWLFAVAGWFGSANGIAMAESMERVPVGFLLAASCVVVLSMVLADLRRWRVAVAIAGVGIAGASSLVSKSTASVTAAERGRMVYLSEGCIHCHSRYPRPGSADEGIWGPAPDPEEVLTQQPVIIGNRRHGPDLANVGARRSEAWLKAHFLDPRALSAGSAMPSYAHLFEDDRGDNLVRYLRESGVRNMAVLMERQRQWTPGETSLREDGLELFARHCAICHGKNGKGDGALVSQLQVKPPDLRKGPFVRTFQSDDLHLQIARVIKFGVVGSDMPGHETLGDGEIMALANLLERWRVEHERR